MGLLCSFQIDPRWIHHIAAMQRPRRQAKQKSQILLLLGPPLKPEILLEGHAFRVERDERHAHADRGGGDRVGIPSSAQRANTLLANGESKEIEPIDKQIGVPQEKHPP